MEKYREVGRQVKRVDARDKVTGRAMFTDDLCPKPCLVAKILHSTIGNGRVVSMDVTQAKAVPGVVGVRMTIVVMVPVCVAALGMGMSHRRNPR